MSAKLRIIIVAIVVVVLAVALGWFIHHKHQEEVLTSAAHIAGTPTLASIPGSNNATAAYEKDQNKQNARQVSNAFKHDSSAVPTITRSSFMGSLSAFNQPIVKDNACPMRYDHSPFTPNPAACTMSALLRARMAGVNAQELRCQQCSCTALKSAGFNASDLKSAGFNAHMLLRCGFNLQALINAGFTAKQLKTAGFSAKQLKAAGFSAAQLKQAGFSAKQLKSAGFSAAQLKAAGFSAAQLKAAGFVLKQHNRLAAHGACSVTALKKARMHGASVVALKHQGCNLADLKAAGFTAAQLKAAGFTAKQLKAAGFSAKQLKAVGFSAKQLKAAGFSAAQLKQAGFSAKQLKAAGFSAKQLKAAGFSAKQLKAAGFSAKQLKAAGFNAAQLKAAGFSAAQLKAAGFTAKQLKAAGFSAAQLKAAGFSAKQLKRIGYTPGDLLRAGFSPEQSSLIKSKQAAKNLCGIPALRAAQRKGVPQSVLIRLGCSKAHLVAAGYKQQASAPTGLAAINEKAGLPNQTLSPATAQMDRIQRLQEIRASLAQKRQMLSEMQSRMSAQAGQLLQQWSHFSAQQVNYSDKAPADAARAGAEGMLANGLMSHSAAHILKAGSVMFAVLETAIDSDEPSPILAKVVTGALKGSTLIGQFTRAKTNLIISFSKLNMPDYPRVVPINAVAIDQNTARTAVSGSVNNHYLLRYGSLFAASFLTGYAKAMQSGTTVTGPLFSVTTTTALTPAEKIATALGKVGTEYAQVMNKNFTVPPTVKIRAGTGIGLLIMSDLNLPTAEGSGSH